jgi:hypothetical protein
MIICRTLCFILGFLSTAKCSQKFKQSKPIMRSHDPSFPSFPSSFCQAFLDSPSLPSEDPGSSSQHPPPAAFCLRSKLISTLYIVH